MRRVWRGELSPETSERLCALTRQVGEAGREAERHRSGARKAHARSLWRNRTANRAFAEVVAKLQAMAPGGGRCMHCEASLGSDVEHFWPKEKYPLRSFDWNNLLWACSACNGKFKGSQFPRDDRGAPLLVNPAEEDPTAHLVLSPSTGKLLGKTQKGETTVRVLGFDRRGQLDAQRRDAWWKMQELLVRYAAYKAGGDEIAAARLKGILTREGFGFVLTSLLEIANEPERRSLILPACARALEANPDIRNWLLETRS